jgi:hypothetical protein
MTRDERILKDLTAHMQDKLAHSLSDYVMLCRSVEIDPRLVATEAMSTLIRLASTYAAMQFNISPAEFAAVASKYFEHARQRAEREDDE